MANDLIQKIEKKMPEFSKGQKLIARYLIEQYDKAAYMTAARLGALVGVSESTVVRFAIELGFDGYPELQKSLQEIIRSRLTYNQRIAVTNTRIGDGDLLDKVLLSDADKIRSTMDAISREDFYRAVDRIIGARRIFIMGVRASASLAEFLSYSLNLVFDNIRLVRTTSGSEVFESLFPMTKEDVLIAISFPRYSSRIVNAVEYAKQLGAGVIALTDNVNSPIAEHASEVLVAQSDMASYIDSLVAPLSVINALTVAIGRKKQAEIAERFDRLETLWDKYDVDAKNK